MSRFKVAVIAGSPQRMGEAIAALTAIHFQPTVAEVADVAATATKVIPITTNGVTKSASPGGGTGTVRYTGRRVVSVRRARPRLTRVRGGAKPSDTARGKIILSVINTKRVARWADVRKALRTAGFSPSGDIMKGLIAEGRAIREGYGLYRQPSTTETLHNLQVKDPTFSATGA